MAKKQTKSKKVDESDRSFLLKIFLYFLLGSLWVRFDGGSSGSLTSVGIPVGMMVGLYFAHHETFQIDRKIEYVVLFLAMILSYVSPVGFLLVI